MTRIATISLLLLLSLKLSAQEVRDFGLWGTVSYGAKISDDFDFSIAQEVRMAQNATAASVIFTNVAVDYRLSRAFEIGLNYRFLLNDQERGVYGHKHRVMLDLQIREKHRQWTFAYRARAQSEIRTRNYSNEFGFAPTADFRNTVKTVCQLNRRFEVYASVDLRVLWNNPRTPDYRGIDRFRYRLGTDILVAREQSIGIFIQHQREINIPRPEVEFMIGLEYKFGSRRQLMES